MMIIQKAKLNKLSLVLGMGMVITAGTATAANQGSGSVSFTGTIIDAPCSIKAESSSQTVDLGEISTAALKNGGKSSPRAFSIGLEMCDTSEMSDVSATFTGAASSSDPDLLGITGTASGASIAITNGAGEIIKLGEASPAQTIQDGNNELAFSAYLQGDAASGASITPGEFFSVANFTLAYN